MCRYVPMFGEVDYKPANAYSSVPFEEQMGALSQAVTAGKVRQIGVSNETPWGLTKLCQLGMHPSLSCFYPEVALEDNQVPSGMITKASMMSRRAKITPDTS